MLGLLLTTAALVLVSLYFSFSRKRKLNLTTSNYAVVITGCDSGFGKLTSLLLTSKGFHVIATCLTEDGKQALDGKVALCVRCDVTKEEDLLNLVKVSEEYISAKNIRLWGLVNNAGIAITAFLDWASISNFRKVFEVNFFSIVILSKLFLPLLKRTRGSRIINLSSVAGISGYPGFGSYSGTADIS